jgi:uncharacterized protein DUF4242
MPTYVIVRRGAWESSDDFGDARRRAAAEVDRFSTAVTWLRSYVLDENDGRVGILCIYEAVSPEAIRRHSDCALLPIDEIVEVLDTVVVRPDPAAAAA